MQILETIQAHVAAMRLPLYAVTLSAVAKSKTPVILILHWHGFHRQSTLQLEGVELPLRSVAGSALQIDTPWQEVEIWDEAMLEAAWRLGAWDLERETHRPWWRLNAPIEETVACHRAFADYREEEAEQHVIVNSPDQAQLRIGGHARLHSMAVPTTPPRYLERRRRRRRHSRCGRRTLHSLPDQSGAL